MTSVEAPEAPEVVEDTGDVLRVRFPVLAIEGMDTGDGRYITPGGLGCRALPLSLAAQPYDPHGGQDSPAAEVFGKITSAERHPGPEVTSPSTGEPFGDGVFVWSGEGGVVVLIDYDTSTTDCLACRRIGFTSVT
jgi:hypothetical protein